MAMPYLVSSCTPRGIGAIGFALCVPPRYWLCPFCAAAAWRLSKTPSLVDELCFAGVLTAAFKAADATHTDATTTNLLKHLEYRLSC